MKGYDYSADQEIGEIADEIEAEIARGSIGPECTRVQAGELINYKMSMAENEDCLSDGNVDTYVNR